MAAFKPAVTGLDDEPGEWPRDHELLAMVASAGQSPEEVSPERFGPPVSPHYAAQLAGRSIEPPALVARARALAEHADVLVCEGVGGLLVPLTPGYLIRDLALDLHLPLVIAARPALGTINHTLLTLEAARAAGLDPVGVVMTPWADDDLGALQPGDGRADRRRERELPAPRHAGRSWRRQGRGCRSTTGCGPARTRSARTLGPVSSSGTCPSRPT